MALTKDELEAARKNGAVIIACEREHGRPQQFHVVGYPDGPAPAYTCDLDLYAVLVPPQDEG